MAQKLVVLTSSHCGPCKRLREALGRNPRIEGFEVEIVDSESDAGADRILDLVNRGIITALPAALLDGQACTIGVRGKDEVFINCPGDPTQ